jgi:hypothetical protein
MRGAIPILPQYAFMAWCSVKKKYRGNFNFTFTFNIVTYYYFNFQFVACKVYEGVQIIVYYPETLRIMLHVEVLWVVTQCSVAVGYQRFRGPCCHHLQCEKFLEKFISNQMPRL